MVVRLQSADVLHSFAIPLLWLGPVEVAACGVWLEPGVWEVQCPRCVAECALCGCPLAGYCFGKGNVPVQKYMDIVKRREVF